MLLGSCHDVLVISCELSELGVNQGNDHQVEVHVSWQKFSDIWLALDRLITVRPANQVQGFKNCVNKHEFELETFSVILTSELSLTDWIYHFTLNNIDNNNRK